MLIRKIYGDFILQHLRQGDLSWILKRGQQYLLMRLSIAMKRPLCGPILASFAVTYKCNYNCLMCDVPLREKAILGRGLKELSTQQLKGILTELADLGVSGIGFTGGEPLLRDDIFELLAHSKCLGMLTHLNTNGALLDNKKTEAMLAAGVDSLNISLDGARAETHDTIRGHQGAFEKTIKAIKCVVTTRKSINRPLRLKVVAVLNDKNIDELADFVQLARDLGTDCVEFIPQQPFFSLKQMASDASGTAQHSFLKKVALAVDLICDLKKQGAPVENSFRNLHLFLSSFRGEPSPLSCYAGYNSLAIDCYGEIYPCLPWLNWGRGKGNINDNPLKQVWHSRTYEKVRADASKCHECYLNCQTELNLLFNLKKISDRTK